MQERANKFASGLIAGGLAALLTQPLEVVKTIILVNPLKNPIIERGYTLRSVLSSVSFIYFYENRKLRNFFRGGTVSCLRQSLGFASYTLMIDFFDAVLGPSFKGRKKYVKYSLTACLAKMVAVALTSPLILVKTRFELITQNDYTSIPNAFRQIVKKESFFSLFRGITSVLSREMTFSIFHYSLYRYLLDSNTSDSSFSIFALSYTAGLWALLVSHPFEVVRNRIMIQDKYLIEVKKYRGLWEGLWKIGGNEGVGGFFKGILPRLVRKPINSMIVWSVYELRNRRITKSSA